MSVSAMDALTTEAGGAQKARTAGLWVLQILLAANFLFAGGGKLAGADMMVATFAEIGLGQWFRYLVGALEAAGAVLLLIPRLAAIGALGLSAVMAGAVLTELFVLSGNPVVPLVLLALSLLVWRGRAALGEPGGRQIG